MQLKGGTPIIEHPERTVEVVRSPEELLNLAMQSALTQPTVGSLTEHFREKFPKFSMRLIKVNLIHFDASDAINTSTKSFHMRESISKIYKDCGSQIVYYFQKNAMLLVQVQSIYKQEPSGI